jgi:hypothetical protein
LTNNNLDHEAVINSESLEYVFRHGKWSLGSLARLAPHGLCT